MSLCPLFWTRFNKTREVQICPESESGFFPYRAFTDDGGFSAPSSLSQYLSIIATTSGFTWQSYEGSESLPTIDSFRHVTTGAEGWAEIERKDSDGGTGWPWDEPDEGLIGGANVYVYEAPISGTDIPVIIEFINFSDSIITAVDTSLAWNEEQQRYAGVQGGGTPSGATWVKRVRVFTTTPGIRFGMNFMSQAPF